MSAPLDRASRRAWLGALGALLLVAPRLARAAGKPAVTVFRDPG